jgi:hypothetical protein
MFRSERPLSMRRHCENDGAVTARARK